MRKYNLINIAKVSKPLCLNYLRFCPNFSQLKAFGSVLSPPAPIPLPRGLETPRGFPQLSGFLLARQATSQVKVGICIKKKKKKKKKNYKCSSSRDVLIITRAKCNNKRMPHTYPLGHFIGVLSQHVPGRRISNLAEKKSMCF